MTQEELSVGLAAILIGLANCLALWLLGRWSEPKLKDEPAPKIRRWWATSDSD